MLLAGLRLQVSPQPPGEPLPGTEHSEEPETPKTPEFPDRSSGCRQVCPQGPQASAEPSSSLPPTLFLSLGFLFGSQEE